jgi:hypothetical protein
MQKIHSIGPVAEVTNETFVEFVTMGGERKPVEFQREVTWILESETEFLYVHGGLVIKHGPAYHDYYGYLKSMELEDAKALADEYSITQDSSLSLVAKTKILKVPVLETDEDKANNHAKHEGLRSTYSQIPETWLQADGVIDDIAQYVRGNELKQVLVYQEVWSSEKGDEDNQKILEAFKLKWARDPSLTASH